MRKHITHTFGLVFGEAWVLVAANQTGKTMDFGEGEGYMRYMINPQGDGVAHGDPFIEFVRGTYATHGSQTTHIYDNAS